MSIASAPVNAFGRDVSVRELLRPLAPILTLEGVTELVVNAPGLVMYEQGADWRQQALPELSYARLQQLARAIATFTDQDIGPRNPILSAILPDGERIQIVVPPAVPPETLSLSIRLPSSTIRPPSQRTSTSDPSMSCAFIRRSLRSSMMRSSERT